MMFLTSCLFRTGLRRAAILVAAIASHAFLVILPGALSASELEIDRILPSPTRLLISLADYSACKERFAETQYGKIWGDPAMREFRDSILQRPIQFGESSTGLAAITFQELDRVATGMISFAVVKTAADKPAAVLVVGVAGKRNEAEALIRLATTRAAKRGAKVATEHNGAVTLVVVRDSKGPGADQPVVMFVRDDWMVIVDELDTAEMILNRWSGDTDESLASDSVYGAVMQKCRAQHPDREPELRWFLDPFAYLQLYFVPDPESDDIGPAKFAEKHGFDSIRGIAGQVHVGDRGHDLLVHVAIDVSPPTRQAMQVLEFPGKHSLTPPNWVAADASAYTAMSWNLVKIIEHGGSLLDDEFLGGIEGTFGDILDDTRRDLRIDLGSDLFARLGPAVTQISSPAAPMDQDNLIVVEVRESEIVADILKRLLRDDPEIRRLRAEGLPNDVWQIPNADLTSLYLTVTANHLLISTSSELMSRFVRPLTTFEQLAAADDWQRVEKAWQPFLDEKTFWGTFSRPQDDILAAYEYLRGGAVGTSDSIYVQLVSKWTDVHGKSGPDYTKLPPFEQIRHHFGPLGIVATTAEQGWLVTGLALPAAR